MALVKIFLSSFFKIYLSQRHEDVKKFTLIFMTISIISPWSMNLETKSKEKLRL